MNFFKSSMLRSKRIILGLFNKIFPDFEVLNKKKVPLNVMLNEQERNLLNKILELNLTMTSSHNLNFTYLACKQVETNKLEGDFCEIGVWRGGHLIAAALAFNDTEKKIYGFDTFEGMSVPNDSEFNLNSGKKAKVRYAELSNKLGWIPATQEEVSDNLRKFGLKLNNVTLVKGDVSLTLEIKKKILPSKISILRIDCDWKLPTMSALESLYSRVVTGGVVIVDDYGSWSGAKEAVDEFRHENRILSPLFHIHGSTFFWLK